jgi:hypothetical protein
VLPISFESAALPGTVAAVVIGLPARSSPVVMSSACSRCLKTPLSRVRATRYIVFVAISITGVPWTPRLPMTLPALVGRTADTGTAVTDGGLVKFASHSGVGEELSASKA